MVVFDRQREADRLGLAGVLVLIDRILRRVDAVREAAEGGARELLGVVLDGVHRRLHGLGAVLPGQGQEPGFTRTNGRELRVEVADPLPGLPHVHEQERDDVLVEDPALVERHAGDAHPFFVVAAGGGVQRPRRDTADVRPVRRGRGEPHALACMEDRLDEMNVVAVRRGHIGVIDHVDVARLDVLRADDPHDLRHGQDRQADEGRQVELALGDQVAVAVVEAGGEVVAFVHGRRIGGLGHRQGHLVAGGDEGAADHLDRDRIDLRGTPGIRHRTFLTRPAALERGSVEPCVGESLHRPRRLLAGAC